MSPAQVHAHDDLRLAVAMRQSAADGRPITCRGAGCFGCCKEPVLAGKDEAAYLVAGLTPEKRTRVIPRLRRWLTQVTLSGLLRESQPHVSLWRMMQAWCPLLEDGKCVAYERRPYGCRAHLAIGDPDACADDTRRGAQTYMECPQAGAESIADALDEHGALTMDNLGVWLAEMLIGNKIKSAARWTLRGHVTAEDDGNTLTLDLSERPERKPGDVRV